MLSSICLTERKVQAWRKAGKDSLQKAYQNTSKIYCHSVKQFISKSINTQGHFCVCVLRFC